VTTGAAIESPTTLCRQCRPRVDTQLAPVQPTSHSSILAKLWIPQMTTEAPLRLFSSSVKPEYIDYNGHMNVAYYVLIFDEATDAYKNHVGLDKNYRERTNCSTFAAELHVTYVRELHLGDKIRVETHLIGHNEKSHHFIHSMYQEGETDLCATMEVMSLHIDLATRSVAPFPDEVQRHIEVIAAEHSKLELPPQVGRVMQVRKKKT